MLTTACLAILSLSPVQLGRQPDLANVASRDGKYKIYWDDKVDGKTHSTEEKSCDIKIRVVGEEVFGEFVGPIAGQNRKASITGRLESGEDSVKLFTFRQREEGYTCSYQLVLGTGSFVGTWYDTKGRSGDFLLLKYQ